MPGSLNVAFFGPGLVSSCWNGSATYARGMVPPRVNAHRDSGACDCIPVYRALDPANHHAVPVDSRLAADLCFLGNRVPDRVARLGRFERLLLGRNVAASA